MTKPHVQGGNGEILMKQCNKCGELKTHSEFHKDKNRKDMLYCFCKICRIQESQQYTKKHKKEISIYMRNYREKNYKIILLKEAKRRANRAMIEFNIDIEDIKFPDKCPVLGIPIFIKQGKGRLPNTPSIDRIDNTKGYSKDNIIIVSWRANNLKSDASIHELKKVYYFYKNKVKYV